MIFLFILDNHFLRIVIINFSYEKKESVKCILNRLFFKGIVIILAEASNPF